MEFRRSGIGGGRRRRVLLEETSSAADGAEAAPRRGPGTTTAVRYADAVRAECDVRLADLIPQRIFSLAVLWLLGLSMTAGLVTLHQQHDTWARTLGLGRDSLSVLDLSATANLSCWVSSSILALAAFTALLIYRLRRHLVDDYRGRYRVWIWGAMLLLLASANCTAGLERMVTDISTQLSGTEFLGDGYVWWIIVASIITTPLTALLLIDMRHSYMSCLVMLMALGCYSTAAALRLGLLQTVFPVAATIQVEATVTAAHLGHLMVLMSLWTFARYVLLGAQGKLPVKRSTATLKAKKPVTHAQRKSAGKTQTKPTAVAAISSANAKTRRSDLNHATKDAPNELESSAEEDGEVGAERLSKAERRRLRKQSRRQHKAA